MLWHLLFKNWSFKWPSSVCTSANPSSVCITHLVKYNHFHWYNPWRRLRSIQFVLHGRLQRLYFCLIIYSIYYLSYINNMIMTLLLITHKWFSVLNSSIWAFTLVLLCWSLVWLLWDGYICRLIHLLLNWRHLLS